MNLIRRIVLAQLIVLVALALSPALEAQAVVLCRKKARILVRDTTCKAKETAVTLSDLGLPPDVVTQPALSTQLAGLVTQSALSTQLAGLVTQSALSSQLAGFVTQSALSSQLADFVTQSDLATQLSSLTGDNIVDRSITLAKLGTNGGTNGDDQTQTITSPIALPAGTCQAALTANFGDGVEGNMVIGTLTNATGQAVLPNTAAVVPSIVIKTTQGGAVPNIIVCNTGGSTLTIPAGSIFHWRMIAAN
jgi:hypothetical protein